MVNKEDVQDSNLDPRTEFTDLVTHNQTRLFGYIYSLVRNAEDAHDLYQQTAMILWRKFDNFERGTNFVGWALRTAQLEFLKFQQSRHRNGVQLNQSLISQLADIQSESKKPGLAEERQTALINCMKQLAKKDRTLVEECYRPGIKIQEVAATLGRTSQSVCNSLRRVRTALLRCVDNTLAQGGEVA